MSVRDLEGLSIRVVACLPSEGRLASLPSLMSAVDPSVHPANGTYIECQACPAPPLFLTPHRRKTIPGTCEEMERQTARMGRVGCSAVFPVNECRAVVCQAALTLNR